MVFFQEEKRPSTPTTKSQEWRSSQSERSATVEQQQQQQQYRTVLISPTGIVINFSPAGIQRNSRHPEPNQQCIRVTHRAPEDFCISLPSFSKHRYPTSHFSSASGNLTGHQSTQRSIVGVHHITIGRSSTDWASTPHSTK